MRVYGINNYYIEILEYFPDCKNKTDIIKCEAEHIKRLKPSLNQPLPCEITNISSSITFNIDENENISQPNHYICTYDNKSDVKQTTSKHIDDKPDNDDNDICIDCYYSNNPLIHECNKKGRYYVKMKGKNSKPKHRNVCWECYRFLIGEDLATLYVEE